MYKSFSTVSNFFYIKKQTDVRFNDLWHVIYLCQVYNAEIYYVFAVVVIWQNISLRMGMVKSRTKFNEIQITTYKYHYIGSQATTIEIDQTQTVDDGEEEPVTTTTKDDEIRIHLGANSRPISFEYYTENQGTQQTTSATYYYHYDLHGNVIRVTNSSGTTVIQYTYDQLGTIVSETNSSNIYNPFTYMGEAQVIQDSEFDTSGSSPLTGLYSSGSGYYNPKTGTYLGGSGAPASANPSSTSAEEPTAQASNPSDQSYGTAMSSAKDGGAPTDSNKASATAGSSEDVAPQNAYDGIDEGGAQTLPGYNPNELPYMPVILMSIEFIMPGGDDEVPIPQPPIKIPGSESFYIIPPPSPGGNNPTESVGGTQATLIGPVAPPDCTALDEFELKKMLQKKWYEEHKYLFENQDGLLTSLNKNDGESDGVGGEIRPCGSPSEKIGESLWDAFVACNPYDCFMILCDYDPDNEAMSISEKLLKSVIAFLDIFAIAAFIGMKWGNKFDVSKTTGDIGGFFRVIRDVYLEWVVERAKKGLSYSYTDFLNDPMATRKLFDALKEEGFIRKGAKYPDNMIIGWNKLDKEIIDIILGKGKGDNQIQPAPVRVLPALQY